MLASITPLGERGRHSTWAITVTAFALGGALGGAAIGALAGALGALALGGLSAQLRLGVLGLGLLLAAASDARGATAPGPRRQVNERWLDEYRGWVYGLGFGTQLGLGLTTVVTSAGTYAALLAAVLSASVLPGALIGGVFGLVRGLTPLGAAHVRTPSQLLTLHHVMAAWAARTRWLAVAGLSLAAALALAGGAA